MRAYWLYGMRERGFGPGCQPREGLAFLAEGKEAVAALTDGKDYWDVIAYSRELTGKEMFDYELDFIGKAEKEETE